MKRLLAALAVLACLTTASLIGRAQDAGITGKWHFVLATPGGDREIDSEFAVDADGKVSGTFGKTKVTGTYKDENMNLDFEMTAEESGETSQMKLVGKLDGPSKLTGTWQFSSYGGDFDAARPAK